MSAEVHKRLEELLAAAEAQKQFPSGEVLRGLRAVEVLERIGTRGARLAPSPAPDRVPKGLSAAPDATLPPAYADRADTPLRAEVQPGAQVLDFDVK